MCLVGYAFFKLCPLAVTHQLQLQEWDVNAANAPCPFDILVANNLSATATHLQSSLAAIHASLAEGGFLLLQVSIPNQPAMLERCWRMIGDRERGGGGR